MLIPSVIDADELVTTLPLASSTLTVGCVNATPSPTVPPGWVVKASLEAVPVVIVTTPVAVAVERPLAVAWSV